ncbi:hypothetical protein [Methylovulum psychrotolerans]|uniref:Polymerase nucleotidyl transferase domain-containing protein n=1 Tax=Methylovulum psychrotolerans TaxID=1704499 RepID=A0A2S5CQS7_9GAMM|nr:hypothetical protein [Methylovulum psychrotolerans]POZ53102.1 hypothetical protein AADEFJLK_00112 [Methylovulum psychrotolerans]
MDFEKRFQALKERRQDNRPSVTLEHMSYAVGSQQRTGRFRDSLGVVVADSQQKTEHFEELKEPKGVKYSIGAMQPVSKDSTEASINEGNRVSDSLVNKLNAQGENVTRKMQGSVALDVHIESYSDIDMLIIVTSPVHLEHPPVSPNNYTNSNDHRSLKDIAKDVRLKSEKTLPMVCPKSDIDCTGKKSIALSGGDLCIKVDIVPAVWFDSIKYQQSSQEHDRGVKIYHKGDHELLLNYPFAHIKKVHDRDVIYTGNLKCVIRLMKTIIADMPSHKKSVTKRLSSYDLAAIAYHMDKRLSVPLYLRLGLVEKTKDYLKELLNDKRHRDSLEVPDGTRKIFDDNGKTEALEMLAEEFNDLAVSIFKELKPFYNYDPSVIVSKAIF